MDSVISNLEIISADIRAVNIVEGYFPSGNISVGSLLRKLPFLLMDLAEYTGKTWQLTMSVSGDFSEDTVDIHLFEGKQENKTQAMRIIHTIQSYSGRKHALNVLKCAFSSDKWIGTPVKRATFELVKQHMTFEYSKVCSSLYHGQTTGKFVMCPKIPNLMSRIRNAFSKKNNELVEHKLTEVVLMPNRTSKSGGSRGLR